MAKKKPALPPYCGYYVWQWNISADYGTDGLLLRVYLNGEPVFPSGKQKKDPKEFKTGHQSIYKMKRLRPKASKGGKELSYLLFDADGDLITIDDQLAIGAGPTRADPVNMGTMHAYTNVEPWRSIFSAVRFPGLRKTPAFPQVRFLGGGLWRAILKF